MTNVCLTIVVSCLLGSFIIEARAHYLINKAMHRRVTALMDFAPDSEGAERYSGNTKGGNLKQEGIHRSSPFLTG